MSESDPTDFLFDGVDFDSPESDDNSIMSESDVATSDDSYESDTEAAAPVSNPTSSSRKYSCQVCPTVCKTPWELEKHSASHKSEAEVRAVPDISLDVEQILKDILPKLSEDPGYGEMGRTRKRVADTLIARQSSAEYEDFVSTMRASLLPFLSHHTRVFSDRQQEESLSRLQAFLCGQWNFDELEEKFHGVLPFNAERGVSRALLCRICFLTFGKMLEEHVAAKSQGPTLEEVELPKRDRNNFFSCVGNILRSYHKQMRLNSADKYSRRLLCLRQEFVEHAKCRKLSEKDFESLEKWREFSVEFSPDACHFFLAVNKKIKSVQLSGKGIVDKQAILDFILCDERQGVSNIFHRMAGKSLSEHECLGLLHGIVGCVVNTANKMSSGPRGKAAQDWKRAF